MFLFNFGYQWGIAQSVELDGAIFRASGQDSETSLRRPQIEGLVEKLFDPQLYLLGYPLDTEDYGRLLSKLATYPWFGMTPLPFDSGEVNRRDWLGEVLSRIESVWQERRSPFDNWSSSVSSCIQFQAEFECTKTILPSGLISDPEDDLDSFFVRLDEAIEVASQHTTSPLLATVAIDLNTLAYRLPSENQLVEALADGLSARDGLAGVYISLSTENAPLIRVLNPRSAGSIMRLCTRLGEFSSLEIVVNFVETLGLACLGLGASAYGAGYSIKGRCLRLTDYRDQGGGPGYPKFHSATTCMDFYSSSDLQKIRDARLLRYLDEDRTLASAPLLDALHAGDDIDDLTVPAWSQRMNNLTEARKHFAQLHTLMGRRSWTTDETLAWLQDAEAAWSYLSTRFEQEPLEETDGRHIGPWRQSVEDILED